MAVDPLDRLISAIDRLAAVSARATAPTPASSAAAAQALPVAPQAHLEARRAITAELASQLDYAARIAEETRPEVLQARLRVEQEITRLTKEREIAKLKASGPDALKEEVRLDRELEQSQRRRTLDYAREEGRQTPGRTLGGAAADVGKQLPGGRFIGHGQNIAAAATGEGAAGISGALGGIGMGAAVAGPMGAMIAAAPAAIAAVKDLGSTMINTIVSMGSAASIGAAMRWEQAMRDATAVIGRVFVPALELLTQEVKAGAGFLMAALPNRQEMAAAFAPVREVIEELKPELAKIAPLIREVFVEGIKAWAKLASTVWGTVGTIIAAVDRLNDLREKLAKIVKESDASKGAKVLGIDVDRIGILRELEKGKVLDPTGQAPKEARMMDMEAYLKETYTNVLTQSDKQDPAAQTAENTRRMRELMEKQEQWMMRLFNVERDDDGGHVAGANRRAMLGFDPGNPFAP